MSCIIYFCKLMEEQPQRDVNSKKTVYWNIIKLRDEKKEVKKWRKKPSVCFVCEMKHTHRWSIHIICEQYNQGAKYDYSLLSSHFSFRSCAFFWFVCLFFFLLSLLIYLFLLLSVCRFPSAQHFLEHTASTSN